MSLVSYTDLTRPAMTDPSQSVAFLEGAQDVTTVGVEDVRGVSTTHYKFTIDLQKALADAPESFRKALSGAVSQLGTSTLPGEVWLDGEGLPRRFAYDMSLPGGTGAPAAVHFSMDLFDFGQPVQVSIPADSDVIDSGALDTAAHGVKS